MEKTINVVSAAYGAIAFIFCLFWLSYPTKVGYEDVKFIFIVGGVIGLVVSLLIPASDLIWPAKVAFILISIIIYSSVGFYIFGVEKEKDVAVTGEMIKNDSDCVKTWIVQPKSDYGEYSDVDAWPQDGPIWKAGDLKRIRKICEGRKQAEELKAAVEKQRNDLLGVAANSNK